jgi:hypothetical protein
VASEDGSAEKERRRQLLELASSCSLVLFQQASKRQLLEAFQLSSLYLAAYQQNPQLDSLSGLHQLLSSDDRSSNDELLLIHALDEMSTTLNMVIHGASRDLCELDHSDPAQEYIPEP